MSDFINPGLGPSKIGFWNQARLMIKGAILAKKKTTTNNEQHVIIIPNIRKRLFVYSCVHSAFLKNT
jgi:hypothetical protein